MKEAKLMHQWKLNKHAKQQGFYQKASKSTADKTDMRRKPFSAEPLPGKRLSARREAADDVGRSEDDPQGGETGKEDDV